MNGIEELIERIAAALGEIPGVEAVVLGGSRARGNFRPDSDIDIGIYYHAQLLDWAALEELAQLLNDHAVEKLLAGPGEWGPWVNAGAWLAIDGQRVDFVLRDLSRVQEVITDVQQGKVSYNYQPGHPHAFVSAVYMGEVAICRILRDQSGIVTALQSAARVYPRALQEMLLHYFTFEADFSRLLAETYVQKDEQYYVVAHLVRSVSCMNQVFFALNKEYCLNEKRAVRLVDGFLKRPDKYKLRVDELFQICGCDPMRACAILQTLVDEMRRLVAEG